MEPTSLPAYWATATQVSRERSSRLRATGDDDLRGLGDDYAALAGTYDEARALNRGAVPPQRLDATVQAKEHQVDGTARSLGVPACGVPGG